MRYRTTLLWLSLGLALQYGCVSSSEMHKNSAHSQEATQVVDKMITTVEAHPDSSAQELYQKLQPQLSKLQSIPLNKQEKKKISDYIQEHGKKAYNIVKTAFSNTSSSFDFEQEPGIATGSDGCGHLSCTRCLVFFRSSCQCDMPLNFCLGLWDCSMGIGAHSCPTDPGPCRSDSDCPSGHRCATWVFKKNECVRECSSDRDCSSGQKCKKPIGTRFKRCK
ncbi:MAG: hypothetical protein OXT67_00205 [Zetaproteobacteria bacterium]|nr:hypothetical protein [Zetaproteobacteria bacterium]